MKELIEVITAGLIALLAFLAGQASAETLIVPKAPAGSGYRIIETGNYPLPDRTARPAPAKPTPKTRAQVRRERRARTYLIQKQRRERRYQWMRLKNASPAYRKWYFEQTAK
jgi:hypothetical protein